MENPHTLQPPNDPIERIRALARDLAYGAVVGLWPTELRAWQDEDKLNFAGMSGGDKLQAVLTEKWHNDFPNLSLLLALGYLAPAEGSQSRVMFFGLTQKAFELLEQPAVPPSVFISYGRKQSSAFALLLECKLSSMGVKAFVDRSIDPGADWHNHLQQTVGRSSFLVCLIAPGTLDSPYVREEVQWAVDARIGSISIWHSNFKFKKNEIADCPDWLEDFVTSKHAIRVQEESAEGYHDAAEKLLNRLGYITD
jgi:hypothetical protein